MTYFNTAQASQSELALYSPKNVTQEARVLQILKDRAGLWFTPYEVHYIFKSITGLNPPVDSIKRSLTVLSSPKKALLVKSEKASGMGIYGRPNHKWTFNRAEETINGVHKEQ